VLRVLILLAGLAVFGLGAAAQELSDPLAPPEGLSAETLEAYERGRLIFNAHWRPSGTEGPDDFEGLGPYFNRLSCASCHAAGGRGKPPGGPDDAFLSAVVRIAVLGETGRSGPHPTLGLQIQDRAIPGLEPEATATLIWESVAGTYPDGTAYELRRPVVTIDPDPGDDAAVSVRVAQPVRGMGVLARAVSGNSGLGRFGWKAAEPSLAAQNAAAFSQDMGLTSALFPVPICPDGAADCGGGPDEAGGIRLTDLTVFLDLLPPPPSGDPDPEGEALFRDVGCAACHVPELPKRTGPEVARAYTDLALHDMGDGLDDGVSDRGEPSAAWRTAPLWGLGATLADNPEAPLLHDGRARGVEEAILWHGGAATDARDAFKALSAEDRARLVAFLSGL
jgi:CxxC motif-containing protein (DUF1111 family)